MSKKTAKKAAAPKKTAKKASAPPSTSVSVKPAKELYKNDSIYCQFDITDYKKSIEFYKNILEWNPSKFSENSPDPNTIGWFEFELPVKGAFLGLGKSRDGTVKPSNSLVISIKSLEEFKTTMESKKIKTSDITDIPNMISFVTVNDPDNNSIMFVAEPRVKG